MPELSYKLKKQVERFGSIALEIQCLEDLNATIDELFGKIEATQDTSLLEDLCPYFGVVWPSARALSEHLVEIGREGLGGKRLLELGCGLAIPSMVASKLGARVTATDFHPEVPRLLEMNVALNHLESIRYERLDWKLGETKLGRFDWVIGSDILYERYHPGPVAQAFSSFLAEGANFVLADPGRPYLQAFADELRRLGLHVKTVIHEVRDQDGKKEIFLLIGKRSP